jgi:hypothetical protein
LAAVPVVVAAWVCRDTTLLRAAEASLVYAAAATSAAATKVNLVIGFLRMMMEAKRTRLPGPSAENVRDYFITHDHRSASTSSTGASRVFQAAMNPCADESSSTNRASWHARIRAC